MATTKVKGGSFGREKRGTSPSNPLIQKSSKPSSPSPSPSSPTAGKPVPNYLKPTISSSLDFSRLPKKSTLDPSSQKPALNRRRSFERPPLASQAIRNVPSQHLRSSSFSQKPGTSLVSSNRPASERVYARASSSLKDSKVEPTLSKSRTLKKSTLSSGGPTSKKGTNAPKCVVSESSFDDQFDSEVMSLPEISEMPNSNQELGDPNITYIEEKIDEGESVIFDQVAEQGLTLESVARDLKPDQKEEKTDKETIADMTEDNLTVEVAGETDEVDKKGRNVENTETLDEEKKEELMSEQEAEKAKVENPSVSSPPAGDAAAPVKARTGGGKKEKQEYNDVIEETASKLMGGKNKSKVMALAGAFQTVISLQDTNKK